MDKKTIKAYDDFAKNYSHFSFGMVMQYQLNQFISFLKGKKVIDIGCGAGRDVGYLKEEGLDVVGIDASENLIKEAIKRIKSKKLKVMDMEKIGFKDETFHGLWCCHSLNHISKKKVEKVIKEFNRVLKKEGIMYLGLVLGEGEGYVESTDLNMKKVYMAYYSQADIERMLTDNGFSLITSTLDSGEKTWLDLFAKKE